MGILYFLGDALQFLSIKFKGVFRLFGYLLPIKFLGGWFSSRRYRELLLGLPALVALIALVSTATYSFFFSKPRDLKFYVEQARAAKLNEREDVADIYLQKAASSVSGSAADRFRQAQLLEDANQASRAMDIYQELAPLDNEVGYLFARLRMIGIYSSQINTLREKAETTTPAETEQLRDLLVKIQTQCMFILESEPTRLEVGKLAVQTSVSLGDGDNALKYAKILSEQNPGFNLMYAELLLMGGKTRQAKQSAEIAAKFLQGQLDSPSLRADARHTVREQLGQAWLIANQYEKARDALLDDGRTPTDPQLATLLGRVHWQWSESITVGKDWNEAENARRLAEKLNHLDKAMKLLPNQPEVTERIARIAGTKGATGERARDAMKRALAEGNASGVVHFVLGVSAMMDGDPNESLRHMELAYQASPNMPITMNNMAYLLATRQDPQLEQAEALIRRAIELNPDNEEFYDTRGMILVLREKWSEAVTDLERALKAGAGKKKELHARLAQAYTKLGLDDLAELHRGKIQSLSQPPAVAP